MFYKYVIGNSAEKYILDGGEITKFLLTGQDTNNQVSIYDSLLPKGNFAPLHYHEIDTEIFYIISGKVEFCIEGELIIAMPGDIVMAGIYAKRSFSALSDSHMLVINTPAGPSEAFLRDIAALKGASPSQEMKEKFIDAYKIHIVD